MYDSNRSLSSLRVESILDSIDKKSNTIAKRIRPIPTFTGINGPVLIKRILIESELKIAVKNISKVTNLYLTNADLFFQSFKLPIFMELILGDTIIKVVIKICKLNRIIT